MCLKIIPLKYSIYGGSERSIFNSQFGFVKKRFFLNSRHSKILNQSQVYMHSLVWFQKTDSANKTWCDKDLHSALSALKKREISVNKASKVYGIPSSVNNCRTRNSYTTSNFFSKFSAFKLSYSFYYTEYWWHLKFLLYGFLKI